MKSTKRLLGALDWTRREEEGLICSSPGHALGQGVSMQSILIRVMITGLCIKDCGAAASASASALE